MTVPEDYDDETVVGTPPPVLGAPAAPKKPKKKKKSIWGKIGGGLLKAAPLALSFVPGGQAVKAAIGGGVGLVQGLKSGQGWKKSLAQAGIGAATSLIPGGKIAGFAKNAALKGGLGAAQSAASGQGVKGTLAGAGIGAAGAIPGGGALRNAGIGAGIGAAQGATGGGGLKGALTGGATGAAGTVNAKTGVGKAALAGGINAGQTLAQGGGVRNALVAGGTGAAGTIPLGKQKQTGPTTPMRDLVTGGEPTMTARNTYSDMLPTIASTQYPARPTGIAPTAPGKAAPLPTIPSRTLPGPGQAPQPQAPLPTIPSRTVPGTGSTNPGPTQLPTAPKSTTSAPKGGTPTGGVAAPGGGTAGGGEFWDKWGGPIATGVGLGAGVLVGRQAEKNAAKLSPAELAAQQGQQRLAGQTGEASESLLGQGQDYLQQPASYYQTLLSGNRAAMANAVAAPSAALREGFRGAERGLERSGVRGAARDVAAGEIGRTRASALGALTTGVQDKAAGDLAGLGNTALGHGSNLANTAGLLHGNLADQAYANRVYARGEGGKATEAIGKLAASVGNMDFGGGGNKAAPLPGEAPAGNLETWKRGQPTAPADKLPTGGLPTIPARPIPARTAPTRPPVPPTITPTRTFPQGGVPTIPSKRY